MRRKADRVVGVIFRYALVAAFTLAAAFGQITGGLRGTVSDPSGAAVAKAKVALTNLETRATRTQTANEQGEFSFELLTIGNYEVRAESAGFAAAVTQAQVNTGQEKFVPLRLEVGQITQTVEVSSAAIQIDTENAQLQTTVRGQAIQEMPVNRDPNGFALTAPGVAAVSQNNPFLGSGSFNANGGRGRGNNITVDGITATDVSVTGTGGVLSPLNFASIKEVTIITNNFDAQYGRNSSSQVIYTTKGGTNDVHGEAYEFLQNNDFNARPFFDRTGAPNINKQNIYGFEAGGPVYLPKILNGKNRFFWHADYEGQKIRGVGAPVIANVPTPGQLATVTDPTSLALVKQYQIPTSPTGTLAESAPNTTNNWKYSVRADVVIGPRDTLWSRYAVQDSIANSSGNTFINSNLPFYGASSTNHPRQALLAETHLFGSSMVNEFRFGFGQSKPNFIPESPYPAGPELLFADGSVTSIGESNIIPQGREQRTYQWTDNFTVTRGSHVIKMGFEWYRLEADSIFDSNIHSTMTFANFNAFATGQLSTYTQNFGNSFRQNRVENASWFIQDDWKVTRNLTLNIGFRTEYAGGPTEANGLISNLDLNNHAAFGAAGAGPLGLLETGKPSFNSNFNSGPRFGFAYKLTNDAKTVVRGGYGIAYDFVFLNPITNQRFLPPLIYSGALSGSQITGANSYANLVGGGAALQASLAGSVGQLNTSLLNFSSISPAIDQNLDNPQVQQWNLGVEREFTNNLVVKLTYVGTKGTYLPRTRPINLIASAPAPATSLADEQARLSQFTKAFAGLNGGPTAFSNRFDPRYNAVNLVESSANSSYNGLQLEAEKRFARNYVVHVAYSWSRSIDDVSDVLGVLANDTSAQQNPLDNRNNRGPSQFDLRHILSISHTWEMPFFRGSTNRWLRGGLGGWSFAGISTYHSGFPLNIYAGSLPGSLGGFTDPLSYLGTGNNVDRPNIAGTLQNFNPQPAGSAGTPSGTSVVNGVAISNYAQSLGLSQPFIGNFGTLGRNVLRLNSQTDFDWDIFKNFHFSERVNLQLRGEFYNIFNLHAFQQVASANTGPVITSPSFGQYTAVSLNARTIQIGARVVF
ncbi:MAG TPA: carboxypeptidase regulatory-like domain-containing protein [Bryobacteraceae bacterium]|jgi:outer membrane receptor protein involved in Fe transport|nr:carboxypeptidase regulatory-like domain-containing protein [Bryobacteraceae bacterium]